jgi:hypothetical protein
MAHDGSHAGLPWSGVVEHASFGLIVALLVIAAGALIGVLACLAIAIGQAIAEWQGLVGVLP